MTDSKGRGLKSVFSCAVNKLEGAKSKPPIPREERNQSLRFCMIYDFFSRLYFFNTIQSFLKLAFLIETEN